MGEGDRGWLLHRGIPPEITFWRDSAGHEVDVIIDSGGRLTPVEIKSAQTVADDFFNGLDYWKKLAGTPDSPAVLVYGGDRLFKRSGITVTPWFAL